jgi:Zn finger protein HypA/HybF involved in hydrogenase expression
MNVDRKKFVFFVERKGKNLEMKKMKAICEKCGKSRECNYYEGHLFCDECYPDKARLYRLQQWEGGCLRHTKLLSIRQDIDVSVPAYAEAKIEPNIVKCAYCHLDVVIRSGSDAADPFNAVYDGVYQQYSHTYCYQKNNLQGRWECFRAKMTQTRYGSRYLEFENTLESHKKAQLKASCKHTGKTTESELSLPFGKVSLTTCSKCGDFVKIKALFPKCPRCHQPFPIKRGKVNNSLFPMKANEEQGVHIWKGLILCCFTCATKILGKAFESEFKVNEKDQKES